jgi:hypothetical protein
MNSELKQNRGRAPRSISGHPCTRGGWPDRYPPARARIACRPPPGCGRGQKKIASGGVAVLVRCAGWKRPGRWRGCWMIRGWCFTRLERRRWNIVPADATIPERQKSSTDDSPTKKAAPARGKPKAGTAEVANAQTLKRNLIQTVRCTACQASPPLSAQCYTAVTPPRFCRSKCDGRHNALPRCNATRRAMFGPSRCRRRGGRNTKQRTTFVFQVFFADVRRFSAAPVVQENSCRTVNLFTRSLPK